MSNHLYLYSALYKQSVSMQFHSNKQEKINFFKYETS